MDAVAYKLIANRSFYVKLITSNITDWIVSMYVKGKLIPILLIWRPLLACKLKRYVVNYFVAQGESDYGMEINGSSDEPKSTGVLTPLQTREMLMLTLYTGGLPWIICVELPFWLYMLLGIPHARWISCGNYIWCDVVTLN